MSEKTEQTYRLRRSYQRPDPADPTGKTKETVTVPSQWVRTAAGATRKMNPGDELPLAPDFVQSLGPMIEPVLGASARGPAPTASQE